MFNTKKIIVYSATNAHGYLTCLIHRLKFHKNDFAIYVGEKESALRCGGNELFDKCILFNHIVGPWGRYNNLSQSELEEFILKYFDDEFEKLGVKAEQVSEFYIGAYWSDFPIYINIKGFKHYVFQEAAGDIGMLSKYDNRFPAKSALQEKYGIFKKLDNPNIINALVSDETIKQYGQHPKIKRFDINEEIADLNDVTKELLINKFNIPKQFSQSENNILVLTNWFTRNGTTWIGNEPMKMYAILCDLYSGYKDTDTTIYLKPHPGEPNKDNYRNYINAVEYFDYKLPSEFLCLIHNIHFNAAFTVASTSINSVKKISDDIYTLSGFNVLYDRMFQIFYCMNICNKLNMDCYYFGVYDEIIKPLIKFNKSIMPNIAKWIEIGDSNLPENSIIIINDFIWRESQKRIDLKALENLPDNSAVFIVTDSISNFIKDEKSLLGVKYITGISITIKPFRKKTVFASGEKAVYLFCKNRLMRSKVLEIDFFEIFQVCGLVLSKTNFSDFENIELKNSIYHELMLRKS